MIEELRHWSRLCFLLAISLAPTPSFGQEKSTDDPVSGSRWEYLGSPINHFGKAIFSVVDSSPHGLSPTLGVAKDRVYAAYAEMDEQGITQVRLKVWEGQSWTAKYVPINIDKTLSGFNPTLAILGDLPIIAWTEYDTLGNRQLYSKKLDRGRWVRLGKSLNVNPTDHASSPELAASKDEVFLVWTEGAENAIQRLYLRKMVPDLAAEPLILNLDPMRNAFEPSIIVDDGQKGAITWSETDNSRFLHVYVRLIGSEGYPLLGNSLNIRAKAYAVNPSIALHDGTIYVAWVEMATGQASQVFVKYWDTQKNNWVQSGQVQNLNPERNALSPLLISVNGSLYLVWEELEDHKIPKLHARRFDGTSWVLAAPPLPTNPSRIASSPAVASGPKGLLLSWKEDNEMGVFKIRVSRLVDSP